MIPVSSTQFWNSINCLIVTATRNISIHFLRRSNLCVNLTQFRYRNSPNEIAKFRQRSQKMERSLSQARTYEINAQSRSISKTESRMKNIQQFPFTFSHIRYVDTGIRRVPICSRLRGCRYKMSGDKAATVKSSE